MTIKPLLEAALAHGRLGVPFFKLKQGLRGIISNMPLLFILAFCILAPLIQERSFFAFAKSTLGTIEAAGTAGTSIASDSTTSLNGSSASSDKIKMSWFAYFEVSKNILLGVMLLIFGTKEHRIICFVGGFLSGFEIAQVILLSLAKSEDKVVYSFEEAHDKLLDKPHDLGNELYFTLGGSVAFGVIAALLKNHISYIMSALGGINISQWIVCLFPVSVLPVFSRLGLLIFFFILFPMLNVYGKNFFCAFSASFDATFMIACAIDVFSRSGFYLRQAAIPYKIKIDHKSESLGIIYVFIFVVMVIPLFYGFGYSQYKKKKNSGYS